MDSNIQKGNYTPNIYIKTNSGTILAFLKAVEIVALVLFLMSYYLDIRLFDLFFGSEFYTNLDQLDTYIFEFGFKNTIYSINRFVKVVVLFISTIIVLDAIGVILLRVTGYFSGLVRAIHSMLFILGLLVIIAMIYYFYIVFGAFVKSENTSDALLCLRLLTYGILFSAAIGVSLAYNLCIMSVMKTIGIERRTEKNEI